MNDEVCELKFRVSLEYFNFHRFIAVHLSKIQISANSRDPEASAASRSVRPCDAGKSKS